MATAACAGGETTAQLPSRAAGTAKADGGESAPAAEDGHGELFPGSETEEPSASAIKLPRTEVGETTTGSLEISGEKPGQPVQNLVFKIEGTEVPSGGQCLGEVGPEGCSETFDYTPTRPGPYTGEATATMADGSMVTVPIYGEAVDSAASTPPTRITSAPPQTPDETETEEWSPEVSSDVPSPEDSDLP
ncbi:hypothetical protein G9272_26800 [Streptomyces asoensis]|uniref:Uncharacterized protein n=1 Tax=Streptomyces asoensis TaxID=249586 RepID=A0A6M4WTG2_9ACTN|nr:hypothetical protein [Streptomyces asoensis]QJT03439.1 hypothetical protein G9272_26800 [Streptomyces asoensis]